MPQGNVHISLNMHATDLISISKYYNRHCESTDVYSTHIDGLVAVFMVHVAGDLVQFIDFALPGSMYHGNNYVPLNMHAIDMICKLIYIQ